MANEPLVSAEVSGTQETGTQEIGTRDSSLVKINCSS
jgi:hypothetical protein